MKQPFFYDVTLRDGNQALKKPWNTSEKEIIFNKLLELGVQGIEVGFSGASDMDFEACRYLADIAPKNVVISGLARAVKGDIDKVAHAIKHAPKPRIHTFIAMNPLGLEYVLKKPLTEVKKIAIDAVSYAKSVLPTYGEVQFSVEHFGDCRENLDEVIEAVQDIVKAGANVINLPNTVERFRPMEFIEMVKKVRLALPEDIIIAVHCHNDLGMASATTVESYFAGATQLECSLNGLGERAGNTNMYEVAVALYNSGVDVPLNMQNIYETSLLVSEMANVPIWEKAPIIGYDALAHRSGIHQDGVVKTKHLEKGAYRAFNPELIGRGDAEKLGFTSQSGKTAIYELINSTQYQISMQEAVYLAPFAKQKAENVGELSLKQLLKLYFDEICDVKGPFKLSDFTKIGADKFNLSFNRNNEEFDVIVKGSGPLDACINALKKSGFPLELEHYEQHAIEDLANEKEKSKAMSVLHFNDNGNIIIARAINTSTAQANVQAVFNGLNLMFKS
ncbi:MAG: alpha-isopropylmalate synthase regulatory domain-containing protein [Candidatus Gastranaerophilales bacterium]|nr:alpha-isopropylmalate synthase regulatory domain-containing protein [Candidatus Gastranaerophilales bacterium]